MKCNLCSQVANRMLVIFTVLLLSSQVVFSQVSIIAPVQADQIMVNGVGAVNWLNNSTHSGGGGNGTQRYVATVWHDGTGCSVSIYNNSSNVIQAIPVPAGYATIDVPDVAVGSDVSNWSWAYVGVVYRATTSGGSSQIFMTTYQIWVDAFNMVNINATSTFPLTASTGGVGVPHIDLIYEESGALMNADRYYVAWEDMDFAVAGVIGADACWGTLSSMAAPPAANRVSVTNANGISGTGNGAQFVDVAGYERPADDHAVFTYYDANRGQLYFRIFDQSTLTLQAPVVVDAGAIHFPRVDAKDPQGLFGTGSNFEIVYEFTGGASGVTEIRGFADGSVINPITTTAFNASITPGFSLWPTVACGIGRRYGVVFWNNITNNIFFQDLEWVTGMFFTTPDYYQVNTTNTAAVPSAIANCWNFNGTAYDPLRNYICWYDPTAQQIKFKFYAVPVAGMFKSVKEEEEFENATIEELRIDGAFTIAPVPAENEIYIQSKDNNLSKKYSIVDMTGKEVLSGNITSFRQHVDISQFAKGIYILKVDEKSVRIVKQ